MRDRRFIRGLRRAQARLNAFSAGLAKTGMAMVRFAALAAAPFALGAVAFAKFEEQMARVATMLDRPQEHMQSFRRELRRMSVEFGETTEALAGGLYDILSASVPAAQALDVLDASVRAAKAGMTDTKTAADALTTILNAYKLEATEAADVSDLLFSVVKRGKTTFAELAPSIGLVATTASAAGVSIEEMGSTLAVMTRNGIRTENAVTALNAIISTFLKPTDEAMEKARSLGFEMNTMTLRTEGLASVLQRIAKLDPDTVAKLFPNRRAIRGVLPALQDMEGFSKDMEIMQNRAGRTDEAFDKMSKTMAFGFRQAKMAAVDLFVEIGKAVSGPFAKMFAWVKRFAIGLRDWISRNQKLLISMLKVIGVVAGIGVALLASAAAVKIVAFAFGGLATVVGIVTAGIALLAKGVALLMTPIGLLGAAIVSLVQIFVGWGKIGSSVMSGLGKAFGEMKKEAVLSLRAIGAALSAGEIGKAAKVLWLQLRYWWEQGTAWLKSIWTLAWSSFQETVADIWAGIQLLIAHGWANIQKVGVRAMAGLESAMQIFKTGVQLIWEDIGAAAESTWNHIQGLWDEGFDVEKANQAVAVANKAVTDKLLNEMDKRLLAIDDQERGDLKEIGEELKQSQDAILKERMNAIDRIWEEAQDDAKQTRMELKKAKEDLEKARQAALKAGRTTTGATGAKTPADKLQEEITKLEDSLYDLTEGGGGASARRGVIGGFRADVLARQVAGTSTNDKILEEQKKNNKINKELLDAFRRAWPGRAVFQ